MKKYLPVAALCVGLAVDILFWKKTPGVSFALFIMLSLILGFWLLHRQRVHPARNSIMLIVPILFFSVFTFIRKDPLTIFLDYALTLFCIIVLTGTFRSGNWTTFSLRDYVINFFQFIGSLLVHPKDELEPVTSSKNKEDPVKNWKPFLAVMRGILIALPILLIFIALFSSADLVFAQKIDGFLRFFRGEYVGEYLFRSAYVLITAYFFMGLLRHAASRSQQERAVNPEGSRIKPFLGFTETSIILGSVILLFSIFVIIQFRYLFFGQSNITQTGFTYSEYARRGFTELVVVAVFSLLLLQGISVVAKWENRGQKRIVSGLLIGLACTVLIILVSAFRRLLLYEAVYGFSELRIYAHVFMIWLGILIVAILIFNLIERSRLFTNLVLLVVIGFAASLNFLNVDGLIVRQNVERAVEGENLDIAYLARLSADSVPELVQAFTSDEIPSAVRDEIGAALVCRSAYSGYEDSLKTPWQSFHLSTWRAERALQLVQTELATYHLIENNAGLTTAVTPTGMRYSCWDTGWVD